MDNAVLALLIGVGCALVFGVPIARRSVRKEKIYGGTAAQALHYIAASAFVGILPVVLVSLILRTGSTFSLAVGFLAVSFVSLLGFAVFEHPARPQSSAEDHGWTKEDAEKSGL